MQKLDLHNIFFEVLDYPSYARPEFFIAKQKQSGWSKGVYLTTLQEIYHTCKLHFRIHYSANKNKIKDLKSEDIKLSVKELGGPENPKPIDEKILEEIWSAIRGAWRMDRPAKKYTPYEIISMAEKAILFIKSEFYEQTKRTSSILGRPRTNGYFTYRIIQEGPFFDYITFKNTVRELLFTVHNLKKAEKTLSAFHRAAAEIVKIWNEELYFIEEKANKNPSPSSSEIVRVEFKAGSLETTWWVSEPEFDQIPHKMFMNQDFAAYAMNVANLINSEILHKQKTTIKILRRNFIDDFVSGIKKLLEQGNSEICIRNIHEKKNLEGPFRDFFSLWFSAKNYATNSESLVGRNHADLKVEHPSLDKKIIEFKGWWNQNKKSTVEQISNYLTHFENEGFIFIINHSLADIELSYKNLVENSKNGYLLNSWRKIRYKRTPFYYYASTHAIQTAKKKIYHFILNVEKPIKVHKNR